MKKRIISFSMGLSLILGATALLAADGDLIVNGNVGIGTTNPAGSLEVARSADSNQVYLTRYATTYNNILFWKDGSALKYWLGSPAWQDDGTGFGLFGHDRGKFVFRVKPSSDDLYLLPDGGNVGIGTASPDRKLHVGSNAGGIIQAHRFSSNLSTGADGVSGIVFSMRGDTVEPDDSDVRQGIFASYNGDLFISARQGATVLDNPDTYARLFIDGNDGNLGIGTTNPAHPLHMASGAYVTAGGVWTDASTRENKENITELDAQTAIDTFLSLTPVTYSCKADPDEKHVGFIAEDVPEIVAAKERKGISPMDIVALLTRVVQEQQREIEKLKLMVEELRIRN